MKIFNKKYRYILPLLCMASFSAQATYSEEQETSNRARLPKAQQNGKFKAGFDEAREKDSVLRGMEISLMHDKSALEENEERLIKCPNRPEYLKSVQNWRKIVQEKQTQINLRTDFLMKKYKEDCDSRQLSLTSSSSQTTEKISDKTMSYREIAASDYDLLDLPIETLCLIASFLPPEAKDSFRQTSFFIKEKICYEPYKLSLKKRFINSASTALEDVLTDMPEIAASFFKDDYTHKIMQAACAYYLNKDGFLAVTQGSLLEGYLNQNYASVPLYAYLNNHPDYAKELFKALFGKELPEEKYELALNLLCGCLPSNRIYVKKYGGDASPLLKEFNNTLLKSMKSSNKKYFLLGIDKDFSILEKEEHVIVINQSNQEDLPKLEHLPHTTVIFNADQEVLNLSSNFLEGMENIILVNGNNQCLTIEDNFLSYHKTLKSCIAKGLNNLQIIKNFFLFNCPKLRYFNSKSLIKVNKIASFFLAGCTELTNFYSAGFNSLSVIGSYFLSGSINLSTFKTEDFCEVKEINRFFLNQTQFNGKKIKCELFKKKK